VRPDESQVGDTRALVHAEPSTSLGDVTAFYEELWSGVEPDAWVSLCHQPVGGRFGVDDHFRVGDAVSMATRAFELCEVGDVWVSQNPMPDRPAGKAKGGAGDVGWVPSLWLDVDVDDGSPECGLAHPGAIRGRTRRPRLPSADEAWAAVEAFAPEVTSVVNSGHGLHVRLHLHEPMLVRDDDDRIFVRRLLDAMAAAIGCPVDTAVFNLDRVLRVPGTFNFKSGVRRPVEVCRWRPELRYEPEFLLAAWPAPRLPWVGRAPRRRDVVPGDPYDELARLVETDGAGRLYHAGNVLVANALVEVGWQVADAVSDGSCIDLRHPTASNSKSMRIGSPQNTIDHEGRVDGPFVGIATVFSPNIPALPLEHGQSSRGFALGDVLCRARFGGDRDATKRWLSAQGIGSEAGAAEWEAANTVDPQALVPSANGSSPSPPTGDDDGELVARWLPDEFWSARPGLAHIREAARARLTSSDAVLHAVLARVAAFTPHTVELPPIVGASMGLSYFAALVGPPEAGKSSAVKVGAELIPGGGRDDVADNLPLGSGEGLAEALFDFVRQPNPTGPGTVKVKVQVRYGAFVYVDEGRALTELAQRSGSTLGTTMRSIYTHATIGNTNASQERRRIVPAGQYVYGIVLAIQEELAGPLLDDAPAGTPQRFCYAMATDPDLPTDEIVWPGPLEWRIPETIALNDHRTRHSMRVTDRIAAEIKADRRAVLRGDTVHPALEAHGMLSRFKIAALLALLDGRLDVTDDDWDLAAVVRRTSEAALRHIQRVLHIKSRQLAERADHQAARREAARTQARISTEDQIVAEKIERVARLLTIHVQDDGPQTRTELHRTLNSRDRHLTDDALDRALEMSWLLLESVTTDDSSTREQYAPGPSKPR
jgi:hypothetical protein